MNKIPIVVLVLAVSICSVLATEVSGKITDQAEALYGKQAKGVFNSTITQVKARKVSDRLERFCTPYKFFLVGVFVPEEKRTSMTPDVIFYKMASAEDAMSIGNSREVTEFLSTLKKPMSNEEDVLEITSIFAELLDAEITTHLPKRKSIIKKYMERKPEDWKLVISGTETGWKAHVTLMTDKAIEYCIRYELDFTRTGNMSVKKEQDIYSYTLYE